MVLLMLSIVLYFSLIIILGEEIVSYDFVNDSKLKGFVSKGKIFGLKIPSQDISSQIFKTRVKLKENIKDSKKPRDISGKIMGIVYNTNPMNNSLKKDFKKFGSSSQLVPYFNHLMEWEKEELLKMTNRNSSPNRREMDTPNSGFHSDNCTKFGQVYKVKQEYSQSDRPINYFSPRNIFPSDNSRNNIILLNDNTIPIQNHMISLLDNFGSGYRNLMTNERTGNFNKFIDTRNEFPEIKKRQLPIIFMNHKNLEDQSLQFMTPPSLLRRSKCKSDEANCRSKNRVNEIISAIIDQANEKGIQGDLGLCYKERNNLTDTVNKQNEEAIKQTMCCIKKVVESQVSSADCFTLGPELKTFLDWIVFGGAKSVTTPCSTTCSNPSSSTICGLPKMFKKDSQEIVSKNINGYRRGSRLIHNGKRKNIFPKISGLIWGRHS